MKFLNRDDALIRLDRLMDQDDGTLGVVWGRRRGKEARHALFVAEAASGGRALTAADVLKVLKQ